MPPWTTTSTDSPRCAAPISSIAANARTSELVVALVARGPPARLEVPGPVLGDLCARVALPVAGVALTQPRVEPHLDTVAVDAKPSGDDLGGAPRTDEVGRPDRVDGIDTRALLRRPAARPTARAEDPPAPASARRRSRWTRRGAPGAGGWACSFRTGALIGCRRAGIPRPGARQGARRARRSSRPRPGCAPRCPPGRASGSHG